MLSRSDVETFYHGIGEKLLFPNVINERCYKQAVTIHSPLSTSTSFLVAQNFTNNGQGLVVTFTGKAKSVANYFPVAWISDYPNEKECFFICKSQ